MENPQRVNQNGVHEPAMIEPNQRWKAKASMKTKVVQEVGRIVKCGDHMKE